MKIQLRRQQSHSSTEIFMPGEALTFFFFRGPVFCKRNENVPMNNKESSDEYYD